MSLASIILTGLASNDPVPGTYLEINFAQGAASGSGSPREVLLMGNKTTAGDATPDTVVYGPDTSVPLQTETDAINRFGAGSELHRMFRQFAKRNKNVTLRAIAVAESGGTAASNTIIVSGTATGNGSARIWVCDEFVDASVVSGDTATVIGASIAAAINSKTSWPVTAVAVTGTVTLTAKNKGPRGNFIRYMAMITSGITSTVTATSDTTLASGATADSNVTALATILASRYYYIVSAAEDATQFGALKTQIDTMAAPTSGLRQRGICGAVGTLSASNTIATGINAARDEIVWSEQNPLPPAELAAAACAVYSLFENSVNPRTNFCGFGNDAVSSQYWNILPSRVPSVWPTRTSIKSALNNGLSPIAVNPNGTTYLVDRITTRSLSGATPDYRIRDAHKVTICDFFADDLVAKTNLNFSGKRIANDPPNGARPPGPLVVTPSQYKSAVYGLLADYDANDLLQNIADIKTGTVVQRETSPSTRMSARIPLQPIDNAKQFTIAVDQVA